MHTSKRTNCTFASQIYICTYDNIHTRIRTTKTESLLLSTHLSFKHRLAFQLLLRPTKCDYGYNFSLLSFSLVNYIELRFIQRPFGGLLLIIRLRHMKCSLSFSQVDQHCHIKKEIYYKLRISSVKKIFDRNIETLLLDLMNNQNIYVTLEFWKSAM